MSIVKRFSKNTKGNDYIVGDLHGTFSKLQLALNLIGLNKETDRLFSVGDLVDRGPESHLALQWLNKPWFHVVRGNHEQMFIDYHNGTQPADNYIQNGGAWAVGLTKEERLPFYDEFCDLPIAIELETDNGLVGIVHADVPINDWDVFVERLNGQNQQAEQLIQCAIWSRDRHTYKNKDIIKGIKQVVVGHTVVKNPTRLGNVIYIDTGSVFERTTQQGHNGHGLTIFDVQSMSTEIFNLPFKEVV